MALVWEKSYQGNHYQVRSAGRSLRLYRNKVFHTQFHPERIVTGDIWELLLLASLKLPTNAKVLLLGAGGGAVANLLNHFEQPERIDVVDLDGKMLEIAQRFFLSDCSNLRFYERDAESFVFHKNSLARPPRYDLIIDDAFGEEDGEPVRAIQFGKHWLDGLSALLKPQGRLVLNFESAHAFNHALSNTQKAALRKSDFRSGIRFCSPRYQNNIAMFARTKLLSEDFRQAILSDKLLRKFNQDYYMRKIILT